MVCISDYQSEGTNDEVIKSMRYRNWVFQQGIAIIMIAALISIIGVGVLALIKTLFKFPIPWGDVGAVLLGLLFFSPLLIFPLQFLGLKYVTRTQEDIVFRGIMRSTRIRIDEIDEIILKKFRISILTGDQNLSTTKNSLGDCFEPFVNRIRSKVKRINNQG